MNEEDVTKARSAVEGVLAALELARIVYVDDANDRTISVEDVVAAAQSLDLKVLSTVFPELGDTVPDDPDVLAAKIRNVWPQLDPTAQAERGSAIVVAARRDDGGAPDDLADLSILQELISGDRLVSLSPAEWDAQKDQLLRDSKKERTLFLFDRDLSGAGGDRDGGIRIIASLLAGEETETLLCGLLTHTVTPETQPDEWEALSKAHAIPRDRFVVIPKLHLSQSPIVFAQTLKFAALSPDFAELKLKTKEIISAATATASDMVEKVSIYDLEHIVFRVPADEGLWEPDMLFRLHAMFHRHESRRLAHDGGALETIAARLRTVSEIPTESERLPTPSSAWALQRKELYDSDDHINKNHLPLELGDIFARVGTESIKRYLLLAQSCDLMVRSDGKRHPELRRIPLVEIAPADKSPHCSEEMPYFDALPGRRWYVKFKLVHFVRGCLLDLCVFNQDGAANLILGGPAPSGIRPAWNKRYAVLSRYWNRLVKRAEKVDQVVGDPNIAKELYGAMFADDLFKGVLGGVDGARSVAYDCKRVGRLSRARAIGLLMSYTATLGRPAYDRDFGRP